MPKKIIHINEKVIGEGRTFIVADIGSNHKQDLQLAKESIDAAAEAGADAVKFQSIQLDQLYYNPDKKTSQFVKQLEFPEEWHGLLNEYCRERNILFFSSPTYMRAVDCMEEANIPLYKLASAQIGTFPQIIEKVAKLGKPTIFSTGISSYEEIIQAVRIFEAHRNDQYMILHCNSIYPTPPDKVNMSLMNTYKEMFQCITGYSDHTIGTHIALLAVSMGASIIEKHFTLHRNLGTPDCNDFASDPEEMRLLVKQIREVEIARSKNCGRLEIEYDEKKFRDSILYRTIANQDMRKGEIIDADKVLYRRTDTGIDCRDFYASGNRILCPEDIQKGSIIKKKKV